ncbi:hypothetical protein DXD11_02685 [Coprococcus sp. TF11-13]|jgi:hypothetical protein|nr:hypothetical protein DXD11_02685 [Coprococcus sp. TF11-13]
MGDTGREVLRKDVKVRGWILFGIFSVIFVFMIITICSMIHNGEFELNSFTGPLIFLTVISVICIWDGIRMIRTPEKLLNRENRNHGGRVFEMADKLYGDLDGAGGDYLEKMRKTDIHDIPHSPYYTGNNT